MKIVAAGLLAGIIALSTLPVLMVAAMTGGGAVAAPSGGRTIGGLGADGGGVVAAEWALQQLGKPYVWGAAGPDAFDCSGLVLRAWEAAGVALPRVAADQYGAGGHVPVANAAPGDLVFFATDPAQPSTIVHVGISLGDGRMVDAPHTGAVVRIDAAAGDGLVPLATRPPPSG
jgi:peptidoglycan DL-endopeptidase CwlO